LFSIPNFRVVRIAAIFVLFFPLRGYVFAADQHHELIVSIRDQKLLLMTDGRPTALYPVSTSKFGIGDRFGSYATPIGRFQIRTKIGMGRPLGTVFKSRTPTGEILRPNAPGRDPIVTRILWLEGVEAGNRNALNRGIYIHGTPQEKTLGRPASYGCIRMKSSDVALLCQSVGVGATVRILPDHLPSTSVPPGGFGFLNSNRLVAANSQPEQAPRQ